jgi:arylsulfatase A-like enzyme
MSDKRSQYPNILLIVLDTARAQNFSCYGHTRLTTPRIDQIAAEGVLYENAIAPSPWTLPSHASLFTGMFPSKHGAHEHHKYLDSNYTTLAEFLGGQGYQTVGFSNNSWISNTFGLSRGFETFIKIWQVFQTETDITNRPAQAVDCGEYPTLRTRLNQLLDGDVAKNLVNGIYVRFFWRRYDYGARRINAEIKRWFAKSCSSQRPFFIFINYLEPHLPYRPPAPYDRMHLPDGVTTQAARRVNQDAWRYIGGVVEMTEADFDILGALYDGELSYLDYRIGEIYYLLQEIGLLEDTLIIITSDHGENIGEHGLMDHQYCLYDTLLKVPLIIRYPPLFRAGERVAQQVQLVDIFPTIMDVLGIGDEKLQQEMQGESLVPDRLAKRKRRCALAEYLGPQPTMEALKRRVPEASDSIYKYDRALRCIRTESFKYVQASDGQDGLYNIREDPKELNNLIWIGKDKADELRSELERWLGHFTEAGVGSEAFEIDEAVKKRLEALGYLS